MYMKRELKFIIPKSLDGERVDTALRRRWGISGSLLKELKKYDDGILINGEHIRTVDLVCEGAELTINMYDEMSDNIVPEDIPIDIMYEDEDILIINKPPYLPTHTSAGHFGGTLANAVIAHYIKNGEAHMFRAVNRLDKDTSGVMCVAKNSYAHARLSSELNTLHRRYTAIVCGTLTGEGTVNAPIARADFIKRAVDAGGQSAVTHYKSLATKGGYTLVELRLETGRTHQIRVHMAHIGYPLLGDWLYGREDKALFPRQALHSSYLSLIHPVTGEKMEFILPLSEDMQKFWG